MMATSGLVGIIVESMELQQGSRMMGESTTPIHGLPDEQGQEQWELDSSGIGVEGLAAQFGESQCLMQFYEQICGVFCSGASKQRF